ncbi:MAG: DUF3300 domain-containing protein [Phycisphaerae bacterium]|nr:DUF3300 domain-containing protein [Phycisphaerae bacterium]
MKRRLASALLLLCVGSPTSVLKAQNAAQPAAAAPAAAAPAPDSADKLSQEQIDQLVAPIALYPDDLLTQMLMASTYPLEIVQADRWLKANKDLKGDALNKELESQTWDASVKALVAFPDTLSMMSEKLDITSKLGDAFIAQQKDVMDAIQRLRNKAQAAGNLQSNQQQTVTVQPAAAGSQTQTIIIQPAQPEVVYVPQYNPTVVYGAWPYPAYPPAPYYPPGYVAGTAILSFGVGVAVGAVWANNSWGHCNWNSGSVNINRNTNINVNNNNFNNANINRNNTNINRNNTNVGGGGGQQWQHNPQHRQGVPYSNKATAQQFGGVDRAQASQARNDFRGRESGGQSPFGGNQAGNRDGNRGGGASTREAGNRPGQAGQGGAGQNRGGSAQTRPANGGAFGDVNKGGGAARDASNRGSNSRGTASQQPARQNNAGAGGGGNRPQAQQPRSGGGAQQRSAPASRPTGGGSRGGGGGGRGGGGRR